MEQLISFASDNGMLSAVWVALVVMSSLQQLKCKCHRLNKSAHKI